MTRVPSIHRENERRVSVSYTYTCYLAISRFAAKSKPSSFRISRGKVRSNFQSKERIFFTIDIREPRYSFCLLSIDDFNFIREIGRSRLIKRWEISNSSDGSVVFVGHDRFWWRSVCWRRDRDRARALQMPQDLSLRERKMHVCLLINIMIVYRTSRPGRRG